MKTETIQTIHLLSAVEAVEVKNLVATRGLSFLSFWEKGLGRADLYRALTDDGDDLGFVNCTADVAAAVNILLHQAGR